MQATLTSKGQVTLPKRIREKLRLEPGDRLEFILDDEDGLRVAPVTAPVTQLKGMVPKPGPGWKAVYVVNVHRAKTELSRLLARVEAGEDVVIARRGEPVARLVACKTRSKRQPDVLKGKIVVPDTFFDPLPEEELRAWEGR